MVGLLAAVLAQGAQAAPMRESPRIDVGVGLDVGLITPGLKGRVLRVAPSGFVAGIDVDVGSLFLLNAATASVVLGHELELRGNHRLRPYGRIGGGMFVQLSTMQRGYYGPQGLVGAGLEWRPGRHFGLGLEGHASVLPNGAVLPNLWLTPTFYF